MTTVLCSRGYPGSYKNSQLPNIDNLKLSKNSFIFHAGTKLKNNLLFSNGGRVLNITEIGNDFSKIRNNILKNIKKINWKKGFFRKDIGWRVIKNTK
jgi:phosphoribosylamine--glycine ligase